MICIDKPPSFSYKYDIMPKRLTPKTYEKLKKELEYLETEGRREIAERLRHTSSFGDLTENFAYQQAREDQALLERRIAELKAILQDAILITENENKDKIGIGSLVTVILDGNQQKFQIVEPEEADPIEGKISLQSPLGQAIFGKKVGDEVTVKTPNGIMKCKIVKIE
jgi:transcription elongation factor GreA